MWLEQIVHSYIHETLKGPGKLVAISDSYPNVQAMAADGSRQEWSACRAWDSAHSGFMSCLHQLVFTFFLMSAGDTLFPITSDRSRA